MDIEIKIKNPKVYGVNSRSCQKYGSDIMIDIANSNKKPIEFYSFFLNQKEAEIFHAELGDKLKQNKEIKTTAGTLCKYGCESIKTDSCPEESPDGFPCTRNEGHEGCHVSCGMTEHGTVKWRQNPKR